MNRNQLIALARLGAQARIAELQAEIDTIRRTFGGVAPSRRGRLAGRPAGVTGAARKPRRRKMSSEARRKISEAAKKRWAAYRAKQSKK